LLDEIQIAATAHSADWIKLAYRSQSPDFSVLNFGQDETNSSGDGHFKVIVQNVTLDGWLIIGLTGIMLVIALLVIISKTLLISRIGKDNRLFMDYYRQLDPNCLDTLNQTNPLDATVCSQSKQLTALLGNAEHMQSSPLYQLYDLALSELHALLGDGRQAIGPEAWTYLSVLLNSRVVAESRALNHTMVLLTIAIAGGPFLGLLGTVVGVMITFADIASTGDVNINSIAPGISAALLATAAGLAVAIPALFAYNYLLSRIKEITSGMRVFADEFLALLAMRLARNNGSNRYA
jgi:biopolymer transport protein ExbB